MAHSKLNTPQEQERAVLAGLIKWSQLIPEYAHVLKSTHFDHKIHGFIYSAILSLYNEKNACDILLLAEKMTSIGVKSFEDLDILDYLQTLGDLGVKEESVESYVANVLKYNLARKIDECFDEGKKELRDNIDKPISELVSVIEKAVTKVSTEHIAEEDETVNLGLSAIDIVTEWGKEQKPTCFKTSFPEFTKMYGGPSFGDVFVFSAAAKIGKSTLVNAFAYDITQIESNDCVALILDTELESWRVVSRQIAALSGVPEFKIKSGMYMKDANEKNKVFKALNDFQLNSRLHHRYIANRNVDDILSIIRRWFIKNVRPEQGCLIVYDYLKPTGQTGKPDAYENYEMIGRTVDKLKKIASELPRTSIITAIQTNRQNQTAISDQVNWFASNLYRLERRSKDELSLIGDQWGSHKLISTHTRVLGEFGNTHQYVKRITQDGEVFEENYINFDFDNFKVTEKGTYGSILESTVGQIPTHQAPKKKTWI